jgi:DNA polymerase-3 subunit epsilon
MDFITIDFETANSQRNSPCEIGLTFVLNKQIVDTKSWLIKPLQNEFDYFNSSIHGITPEDVANSPEFDELWPEIKPLIENKFLIAHNASFDFSVLRKTLETYNIPYPTLKYSCSYIFSKKLWPRLPAYDLKTLCNFNNIEFNHHRAGADSKATAELALKAIEFANIQSLIEFAEKLQITVGEMYDGGYNASRTKRTEKKKELSRIIGDPEKHKPDSVFYGRIVVFTGALSTLARDQAKQIVADIGGIITSSVSKNTDFLIVGQQDYRIVGEDGMSSKQEKAIKLIEEGSALEILSEDEFLKNL